MKDSLEVPREGGTWDLENWKFVRVGRSVYAASESNHVEVWTLAPALR